MVMLETKAKSIDLILSTERDEAHGSGERHNDADQQHALQRPTVYDFHDELSGRA
jgi:hypothetical protein